MRLLTSWNVLSQSPLEKPLRHVFQKTAPSKISYGNNPNAGHYANADDAKIYYEVYGKGEPIVLLHGDIFGATIANTGSEEFPIQSLFEAARRVMGRTEKVRSQSICQKEFMVLMRLLHFIPPIGTSQKNTD